MNTRSWGAYLLSTLVVVALALLFRPAAAVVGWYWCISFWSLVALDFYSSEVKGQTSTRWSFVDRFLGYLFAAPFIFPARLLALLRRS